MKNLSANSQTVYNILSAVIRTGISFFTIPIFARLLGTEQYGLYSLYISWYNILCCFISLGCGQGIATGMYVFKDDYPRFRSSILLGGTLMCGVSTIIGILLFFPLSGIVNYPFPIYLILFLESSSYFVSGFASSTWIYEKQAAKNMILSVATLVSTTAVSLLFISFWNYGDDTLYIARILGVAFPSIIISIIVWCLIYFQKPAGFNKTYWNYSFSIGIPTIFHSLSHQILTSSDRIMMRAFEVSNSEIGIYSFFYLFVSVLSLILGALNNSWVPFLYDDLDKHNYANLNVRIKYYVQDFTVVTCGFIMLSREVSAAFSNEEFWSGVNVMPIIAIGIFFTFIYQFPVNYEFFKTRPRIIAFGTMFAASLNIIFNAILIPKYGMYGAAIATMFSYAMLAVIHFVVVLKWNDERYPLIKRPLIYGLIAVLVSSLLFYVLADFWYVRWAIGILIGLGLLCSVYKRRTIF